MKVCTRCGEEKDFGDFGKDKVRKDGLTSQCKACRKLPPAGRGPKPTHSTCTICKESKPLDAFHPRKTGWKGVGSWCRDCFNPKQNERRKLPEDEKARRLREREEESARVTAELRARTHKPCLGECGRTLPVEEFYANSTQRDGKRSWCKDCTKAALPYRPERDKGYKDKAALRNFEYFLTHGAPLTKKCSACRVWKDIEDFYALWSSKDGRNSKCISCTEEYNARPHIKELRAAYSRKWAKENSLKALTNVRKRQARKLGVEVEHVEYEIVYARDKSCYLCGQEFLPDDTKNVDHIIPLARPELGPTHSYSNCAATHKFCNISKGSLTPTEYWAREYSRGKFA